MEYSGFYDDVNYASEIHAKMMELIAEGVVPNYLNELKVAIGTGLQVTIDSGGCIHEGRYYIQEEPADGASPKTLPIDAASSGYLRKDRTYIEWNISTSTGALKVEKGTEAAANPTAPSLSESSSIRIFKLGIVNVDGGTITGIEDERVIGGARTTQSYITGEIKCVAFLGEIEGWLDCDGGLSSRTEEADLFARIGTLYGAGDGSTTFARPDFRERTPVGYKTGSAEFGTLGATHGVKKHQLSEAELPAHVHDNSHNHSSGGSHNHNGDMRAFTDIGSNKTIAPGGDGATPGYDVANTSNPGGEHSHSYSGNTGSAGSNEEHQNIQPSIAVRWIIKT
jgi:microcystin-dependent protein